jgi:hypothetical protein
MCPSNNNKQKTSPATYLVPNTNTVQGLPKSYVRNVGTKIVVLTPFWESHMLRYSCFIKNCYVTTHSSCVLEQNNQPDATISRKIYCLAVQILLNMFRASQCISSGARQTTVAASGFHMNVEVEVFSAVVGLLQQQTN